MKTTRKFVIAFVFILAITSTAVAAPAPAVRVTGYVLEQTGVIENGKLLIPAHAIAEALGMYIPPVGEFSGVRDFIEHVAVDIEWDFNAQTLHITREGR